MNRLPSPLPIVVESRGAARDDVGAYARIADEVRRHVGGLDYTATMSTTTEPDGTITISVRARVK